MKQFVLIIGSLYGIFSVIFGAFGAHLLKKMLDADKLASFEVGVRYQMYHALLLLILGFFLQFETTLERSSAWLIIVGTFLFSFSIYLLSFSNHWNLPTKIIGPITPIGGLLMILGWACLLFMVVRKSYLI